jgi:hypothetical protein
LTNFLNSLSQEDLLKKAARHFKDAFYCRKIRNDLDYIKIDHEGNGAEGSEPILKFSYIEKIYDLQTHPLYQKFMAAVAWLYLVNTFWEPVHLLQEHPGLAFDDYKNSLFSEVRIFFKAFFLSFSRGQFCFAFWGIFFWNLLMFIGFTSIGRCRIGILLSCRFRLWKRGLGSR